MRALDLITVLAGCRGEGVPPDYRPRSGGDAARGRAEIVERGCPACHDIPGIRAPGGRVGPPLRGFATRSFIAGELPNNPENLIRWISDPQAVNPHTAMPTLGLTQEEARDVAAFLYTLD
jgi:cytochrome c1